MLSDLDTVDWAHLEHAYGSAEDVPDQLRALASPDADARQQAIHALYGNIWHQGTVYQATAYAVPFLLELLRTPAAQDKDAILTLLQHLATGSSYLDVHQDFATESERKGTPEFQAQMRQELDWVRAARDAVARGLGLYGGLLLDPTPAVRMTAAYLLAVFPEHSENLTPLLWARLAADDDPRVRATIVLSLAALTWRMPAGLERFAALLAEGEQPLVRLGAAVALAGLAREAAPPATAQLLADAVAHPDPALAETYRELPWSQSGLLGDAANALAWLGSAGRPALPLLEQALHDPTLDAGAGEGPDVNTLTISFTPAPGTEGSTAAADDFSGAVTNVPEAYPSLNILRALLALTFGGRDTAQPPDAATLTPEQRAALAAITASEPIWRFRINAAEILRAFGLPDSRATLRQLLGEQAT